MKVSQLGSLKEQLATLKYDPGPKGDKTKIVKFRADVDGILDRIERIEAGRVSEMRWLGDINTFVARLEKLCEIKFVEDGIERNSQGQSAPERVPEGARSEGVAGGSSTKK